MYKIWYGSPITYKKTNFVLVCVFFYLPKTLEAGASFGDKNTGPPSWAGWHLTLMHRLSRWALAFSGL